MSGGEITSDKKKEKKTFRGYFLVWENKKSPK